MSVIILSHENEEMLEDCLASLSATIDPDSTPYEVIVLFQQASEESTRSFRERVVGMRALHAPLNLGFGAGNNFAAASAKGAFLAFVNDDATMRQGWLTALVSLAQSDERIGAVGSRILFPNGTLQEAGAIVWSDGSCHPLGRGEPVASLAYSYVRDVQHTSANGLLVRRSTFERIGGFDERFFPAYYEDVDLCLKIRHDLDQRVVYQPRSVILHHESATANRDPEFRTFLFRRHQERFTAKWRDVLSLYPAPQPDSAIAIDRAVHRACGTRTPILVVDDRIPNAGLGSGFGRTADLLTDLATAEFAVSFAPTDRSHVPTENSFGALGVEVITEPLLDHLKNAQNRYELVIVSRPHNMQAYYSAIRGAMPHAAVIYDVEALYHRRLLLQARLHEDAAHRERLNDQADAMETLETFIACSVDRLVAISDAECQWLLSVHGHAPVEFMRPLSRSISLTTSNAASRIGAVFVAGWLAGDKSPNVDALRWYAEEISPRVRAVLPEFVTFVTGARPPLSVQSLAGDGVVLSGFVHSIESLYRRARIAIAPILAGAGVKIKTIEALQYGVPVVATTVGAEGLPVIDGVDIDISDDPQTFADRIVALATQDETWMRRRAAIEQTLARWDEERITWAEVARRALQHCRSTSIKVG